MRVTYLHLCDGCNWSFQLSTSNDEVAQYVMDGVVLAHDARMHARVAS